LRISALATLMVLVLTPCATASVGHRIDWAHAERCVDSQALCLLGHDPGNESGVGDDQVHLVTVWEGFSVHADVPLVGSREVSVDSNDSYEHPVFITAERVWSAGNDALPGEVKRYVRLKHGHATTGGQGLFVDSSPWALVPLAPEDHRVTLMIPYMEALVTRDRIQPLGTGGRQPFFTDYVFEGVVLLAPMCRPEEETYAGIVCHTRGHYGVLAAEAAMASLPNIGWNSGIQQAVVSVNPLPPPPAPDGSEGPLGTWSREVPGVAGSFAQRQEDAMAARDVDAQVLALSSSAFSPPPVPREHQHLQPGSTGGSEAPLSMVLVALAAASLLVVAVALYRRLQPKDLLAHPKRQALLALVQRDPGVTIGEAARVLGLSYKTAMHHADLLIEASHLAVHLHGRERRLFPPTREFQREARQRAVALDRPSVRAVVALLDQVGPVPRREVGPRAGLSRTAAWEALETLRSQGVVAVEPGPRGLVRPASPAHISEAASPPPLGA
jgi:hypothetical protein